MDCLEETTIIEQWQILSTLVQCSLEVDCSYRLKFFVVKNQTILMGNQKDTVVTLIEILLCGVLKQYF